MSATKAYLAKPRSERVHITRERITHPQGTFAPCGYCADPAVEGTLVSLRRWESGRPIAGAVFICDACLVDIIAADQAYAASHILESAR